MKLLLLFFSIFFVSIASLIAQEYQAKEPVPTDRAVKIGRLENGLTYYIRKNNRPVNQMDMCLVSCVGALVEEDHQNGFAHFVEHMAFRGTKHFPDDELIKFCEKNGVKFGENLNGFTNKEYTMYLLSGIPLTRESLIDSILLIMSDWSGEILFDQDRIEKERNVVIEERRTYGNARFRIDEQLSSVIFHQTRHAYRNVIGNLEVLNSFTRDEIVDFYQKWYRPDLQALILVGDFDPEQIEQKVKELFEKRPAAEKLITLPKFPVPDHQGILTGKAIDPEAGVQNISIIYTHKGTVPENRNQEYFRKMLIARLINIMFFQRMTELNQQGNQPFSSMLGMYSHWVADKDALITSIIAKDSSAYHALMVMLTEMERVKRFGFTANEFERAKVQAYNIDETAFNERYNRTNGSFIGAYIAHFINLQPIPSVGYIFDFTMKTFRELSIDEVNKMAKKIFTQNNIVVTQSAADTWKLLSDDQIKSAFADIGKTKIEMYKDPIGSGSKKLMTQLPASGTVVATKKLEKPLTATEWALSNGARVVLYPTGDRIIMSAFSLGGSSLVNDADFPSCRYVTDIAVQSGIAGFNLTELMRMMNGKNVLLSPYINEYQEGFVGQSSSEDLETMFQMLYLYFTQPRFNRETFHTALQRDQEFFMQKENNPSNIFNDSVRWITTGRHLRRKPVSLADLNMVNFETIQKIYGERFADAGDFTFFFVGGFKEEEIKPLVEQYIASLPGLGTKENFADMGIVTPNGNMNVDFKAPMQTPKTSVRIRYSGKLNYGIEEIVHLAAIQQALEKRYRETIRQEEGASYIVEVAANIFPVPYHNYTLDISFNVDPKQADNMIEIVHKEIERLVDEGLDDETIANTKEFWLKNMKDIEKNNVRSIILLSDYYILGVDRSTEQVIIENLTKEAVKKTAQKALMQGNIIQIVMRPD